MSICIFNQNNAGEYIKIERSTGNLQINLLKVVLSQPPNQKKKSLLILISTPLQQTDSAISVLTKIRQKSMIILLRKVRFGTPLSLVSHLS